MTVVFGLYHGLCLLPVLLCLCGPVPNDLVDHHTEEQNKVKPIEDVNELPRSIDQETYSPVTILQNANYDKVYVHIVLDASVIAYFSFRIRNLIYLKIFNGHLDDFSVLIVASINAKL